MNAMSRTTALYTESRAVTFFGEDTNIPVKNRPTMRWMMVQM